MSPPLIVFALIVTVVSAAPLAFTSCGRLPFSIIDFALVFGVGLSRLLMMLPWFPWVFSRVFDWWWTNYFNWCAKLTKRCEFQQALRALFRFLGSQFAFYPFMFKMSMQDWERNEPCWSLTPCFAFMWFVGETAIIKIRGRFDDEVRGGTVKLETGLKVLFFLFVNFCVHVWKFVLFSCHSSTFALSLLN